MKYREFGKTGIKVSEVGMGCWAIGGNQFGNSYGSTDDVASIKTIKRAMELGCDFFDTADVYGHGHSEELLGLALHKSRDKVFIATKVGGAYMYGGNPNWGSVNFSEDYIRFALEKSLQRLKTSYLDLYQLHNPPLQLIKDGKIFDVLGELKKEGKIKFFGISIHTWEEGEAALKHEIDSIQCVFNMLDPKQYEVIEGARVKGVAIIAREPLCNGFLVDNPKRGPFEEGDIRNQMPKNYVENLAGAAKELREMFKYREEPLSQIALKYVLMSKGVSVTIPGAKTPEQLEQNLKASDIPDLTEKDLELLGS